jgi:hypothetical protein
MICHRCGGTKKYRGNGMVTMTCTLCDVKDDDVALDKVDRTSESYKKAIKEIMDINPGISPSKAAKMFDKAYDKV